MPECFEGEELPCAEKCRRLFAHIFTLCTGVIVLVCGGALYAVGIFSDWPAFTISGITVMALGSVTTFLGFAMLCFLECCWIYDPPRPPEERQPKLSQASIATSRRPSVALSPAIRVQSMSPYHPRLTVPQVGPQSHNHEHLTSASERSCKNPQQSTPPFPVY